MFNMFSAVNLFFMGTHYLVAFVARKSGYEQFADKEKKRAQRCMRKINFYEGSGPWPEKS